MTFCSEAKHMSASSVPWKNEAIQWGPMCVNLSDKLTYIFGLRRKCIALFVAFAGGGAATATYPGRAVGQIPPSWSSVCCGIKSWCSGAVDLGRNTKTCSVLRFSFSAWTRSELLLRGSHSAFRGRFFQCYNLEMSQAHNLWGSVAGEGRDELHDPWAIYLNILIRKLLFCCGDFFFMKTGIGWNCFWKVANPWRSTGPIEPY